MTSFFKNLLTLKDEPPSLEYKEYGIRLTGISFKRLIDWLGHLPGVIFTGDRPLFWTLGGEVDFTFRDYAFAIETDSCDGALWVVFKSGARPAEMQDLHEHIQRHLLSMTPAAPRE